MSSSPAPEIARLVIRTVRWTAILMAFPACLQLLSGPPAGGSWTLLTGLHYLVSWGGLFLPYAAFAGGLEASSEVSLFRRGVAGLLLAMVAFLLLGFVSPHLEYKVQEELGTDLAVRFPTGPITVGGSIRLRAEVLEHPPTEFGFSVERPLQSPPNWLCYLIHSVFVLSSYSILAVFLGSLTASLTSGLSPPSRRNVRWAVGLGSGVLFFMALAVGGDWVKANPMTSGAVAAWGALLVPLGELGILFFLLVRARRGATLSAPVSSNA